MPQANFIGQLYEFQQKVIDWALKKDSGIIGLDMGLGKTVITIALICQKQYQSTLIIVPLAIMDQWKTSILKFTTLIETEIGFYHGSQRHQMNLANYPVILSTYDVVNRDMKKDNSILAQFVATQQLGCLVLDEAHKIRNHRTRVYNSCLKIRNKVTGKWLLTGTTIHNKFDDFYHLCLFIGVAQKSREQIAEQRDQYYIRLSKKEVELGLPNKTIQHHQLRLDEFHQAEYDRLFDATNDEIMQNTVTNAFLLVKILQLRQCCNYMRIGAENPICPVKFQKSIEIIKKIPQNDKIIIFSQWETSLRLLAECLEPSGIVFQHYSGKLTAQQRNNVLTEFRNQPETRILLVTIQSGGVGLDLSCANHVIILDNWWNNALEQQAIDRVYRIGQKKNVMVHTMSIQNSIESWIMKLKKEKLNIDNAFHEESELYIINKTYLRQLLHYYTRDEPIEELDLLEFDEFDEPILEEETLETLG